MIENKDQQQVAGSPVPQGLPFAEAVAVNGMLYISGQVGIDPASGSLANANFKTEAQQVMKNLGGVLQRNGLSYADLVSVTIYLIDMDDYTQTNEVYRLYFTSHFPARVCIAVRQLPLGAQIEISAIAKLSN
jgi:reactive intermediate/imine deaminase